VKSVECGTPNCRADLSPRGDLCNYQSLQPKALCPAVAGGLAPGDVARRAG